MGDFDSKWYKVVLEGEVLKVVCGALVVLKGTYKENLYYLDRRTITGRVFISNSSDNNELDISKLWHMRLGHVGEKVLQSLVKQGILKDAKTRNVGFYEHCVLGKHTKVKFGTTIYRTEGILDYVHSDVWGPSKNVSFGGPRYFVIFIDDFSRRVWVYTMRHKDEVLEVFLR